MTFRDLLYLIKADLYRYTENISVWSFLKSMVLIPGVKYSFWMRLTAYLKQNKIFKYSFFYPSRLLLAHYSCKFGISIPFNTQIGSGFYISHHGGIVVHHKAIIGKNCNMSQGVTIGQTNRGTRMGCPTIGDNVYVGPGAKIIGRISIGNNVAIGANCVVTKDVPDNAVVVGIPGKVISYEGSAGYVNRTNYPQVIRNINNNA